MSTVGGIDFWILLVLQCLMTEFVLAREIEDHSRKDVKSQKNGLFGHNFFIERVPFITCHFLKLA
jgi:hypothetical protein